MVGEYWVPLVEVVPVRKNRYKSPTLANKWARRLLSITCNSLLLLWPPIEAPYPVGLIGPIWKRPPAKYRQLRKLNEVALCILL